MANEKTVFTETFIAGEDLREYQYHGVKLNGDRTVDRIDADTDIPVGVLLNEPNDGEEALVMIVGRCPVVIGELITAGMIISFDANGEAEPRQVADTDNYPAGTCTIGGAAAVVGEMIVGIAPVTTA